MMTILIISEILLVLGLVAMSLVVFALARQIGVLHERLAPLGAIAPQAALAPGQAIPRITMRTLSGQDFVIGERLAEGTARMLLFVAPDCPICKRVIPQAVMIAERPDLDLVLVGDGAVPELAEMNARLGLGHVPFVTGAALGLALQVSRLPTLVVVDDRGQLLAREIVNTRSQIEALLAFAAIPGAATSNTGTLKEPAHAAI